MEEKKQGKFKFNAIDVLIILALIACIVGIAFRLGLPQKFLEPEPDQKAEIRFSVNAVDQFFVDQFKDGIMLYDADGEEFGSVKDIEVSASSVYKENDHGVVEKMSHLSLQDVVGTITVTGLVKDDGFYMNGDTWLGVGQYYTVKTESATIYFLVTGYTVAE